MIPRTVYEPEHEMFRDSVSKFLETEVVPFHAQWEKDGQVDRELWRKAGAQGFLVPTAPEEYGGVGADYRYNAILNEELGRTGATGIGWPLHSDIAVPYLMNFGNEEQKQRFLPGCISGDIVTAIAMTEPGAGSDLQGIKTTAIADGDDFILNGSKTFITNGQHADVVVVVAKTDASAGAAGISLLLVEAGMAGFEKGSNLEKLGMKAQDTSELFFNDVRVPRANLLGEEGKGFIYLMQELPQERLQIALVAIASMEAALDYTTDYVKERKAFNKQISDFQNTQFMLADMATDLEASRALLYLAAAKVTDNAPDKSRFSAMAKRLATDNGSKIVNDALQLFGGYGYLKDYPIERFWRDLRVHSILEGTNQVMRMIVGRDLLRQG